MRLWFVIGDFGGLDWLGGVDSFLGLNPLVLTGALMAGCL